MAVARRNRQQAIEVGSITDLLTAFRIRKDELGLNMTQMDALAGFQFGYTGKLFSNADSRAHRRLTDFSLAGVLAALECKLVLVPADDDDGGKRLKQRISELREAMRAAGTHVAEPDDFQVKKVLDVLENEKTVSTEQARRAAKKRWARYGKKTRSQIGKDLAAKRWADGMAERRKAKRSAAARKAVRARWDRLKGEKGRAPSTSRAAAAARKTPEPTPATSAAVQPDLFPSA